MERTAPTPLSMARGTALSYKTWRRDKTLRGAENERGSMQAHRPARFDKTSLRRLLACLAIVLTLTCHALASSRPRSPLQQAAHEGDVERTKHLLAEGQSQYLRDSALEFAIQAGHHEVMELLIAHGARYALVKATEKGDIQLVKHLLAQEHEAKNRNSAFHAAVRMQHRKIARWLLDHGADVDTRRWNNLTPLFFAVTGEREGNITHWLTEPRYQRSRNGRRSADTLDIVEFLIKRGADVNAQGGSPALTPLYYAIHGGGKKIVETLIAHGADVDPNIHISHMDSRFTTPLHLAADYGDLAMCKLLVEHGADVNAQMPRVTGGSTQNSRRTPLHHAACSDNAQLVTFLLDHGADINAVSGWGRTVLHTAIWLKKQQAAEILLSRGAEVNTATETGQTPLHSAVTNKNRALVELLLTHDAEPNPKDNEGRTPTSIAVQNGSEEIVELLAARLDRTTLHSAASVGALETMAALVDSGVDVDRIDVEGATALHAAVKAGHVPVVRWLLAQGANPTSPDDHDATPLSIAFRIAQDYSFSRDQDAVARFEALKGKQRQIMTLLIGHGAALHFAYGLPQETVLAHPEKVTDLLIEAGTNFEPHRDRRATLLHRAAWWGNEEVVADLLELDADIHATDEMGATALHAATQNCSTRYWDVVYGPDVEVLELLIEHGARVNATNKFNETALHGAAGYGDPNAIALLIRHGARVDAIDDANRSPLHAAATYGYIDVMNVLIANGADPNIADDEGNTPLLLLLAYGSTRDKEKDQTKDCAIRLIRQGARVDVQNNDGMMALHFAAARWGADILVELLRRGAPVNTQSIGGWTPLLGAVDNSQTECVKILIEHGAHVNVLGHELESLSSSEYYGPVRSPLQLAVSQGDDDIVQLLITAGADLDLAGDDRQRPLYTAYLRNRRSVFRLLLDSGADPNTCVPNGVPLIYAAAARQDREIVDALLQRGVQADAELIETLLQTGTTPLHTAAKEGDVQRVSQLLAEGAQANMSGKGGRPIHHAYAERHIDIVERLLPGTPASIVTSLLAKAVMSRDHDMITLLITHGADVNAEIPYRLGSPLHWLAYDLEMMELLLTHGADVNATNGTSETALTRAVMGRRKDVVALLLAHGADCNIAPRPRHNPHQGRTPLHIALFQGSFEIARMLVEAGSDVNTHSGPEQLPPLHMAVADRALFKLMLARGARIDSRSYDGKTCLHVATERGQADTVEYLLDKGAPINAQDRDGNTALHLAAKKGHASVCRALLQRHADVTIHSKRGRLALDYAIASELDDIVAMLRPAAN